MARRIAGGTAPAPVVPQVPNIPAPAYPAQAVPAVPPMPAMAPPAVPMAPPQVQAPPMEQQLAQAVYQAPMAPPAVPMTQAPPPQAVAHTHTPTPAPAGQSPMHFDMGSDAVRVFKTVPAGTVVEAEITKATLEQNTNNNWQVKYQLRTTWPQLYVGAVFFDQCVLVPTAAWKYKSLYAACEDENGNRLLSEDNRFFTGSGPEDLVGNVVRFTAGEPTPAKNDPSTFYNQVKGGFEAAFETFAGDEAETAETAATPAPMTPPAVPQF